MNIRAFFSALTLITQLGGPAMANDDVLTFKTHDLSIDIYDASDLNLIYSRSQHNLSKGKIARKKTHDDENKFPNFKSGSYFAFPGPVELNWRSSDGETHSFLLDLDKIFKDRKVLHTEDQKLIYKPKPITGGEPTIIIEVNNRTLNVYMFATVQTISQDPNVTRRNSRDHRTLAFSQTF